MTGDEKDTSNKERRKKKLELSFSSRNGETERLTSKECMTKPRKKRDEEKKRDDDDDDSLSKKKKEK